MSSNKKKKAKSNSSNLFWKIAISFVGLLLILMTVVNFLLFLFGETAYANVATRRVGGADDGKAANQRYEWSLDYSFVDKNSKKHNGHTTRRGGDMSVKTDDRVYYFAAAPVINALESDAEPSFSQLIFVALGVFIIYAMNSNKNKSQKKNKGKNKSEKNYTLKNKEVEIHDYDDSVEELFQDFD